MSTASTPQLTPISRSDQMDATYAWLRRNFSGSVERLRRDHDLSPGDFYDAVGLPPNPDEADDAWEICYEPTIRGLEDYLEELERDRGRAATTVGPRRSRPKTYSTTYKKVNETDDLLHDGGTTTATARTMAAGPPPSRIATSSTNWNALPKTLSGRRQFRIWTTGERTEQ